MKLVQFLRPLFFVALGLHGLLLFLPIGEAEPAVGEDTALEERPKKFDDFPLILPVPGALPVPDPNVSTATARARVAAMPTPARVAAAARSAPRARPPVALARQTNDADAANADTDRSTESSTARSSSLGLQSPSTPSPDDAQQTAANGSSLPDLSNRQNSASTDSNDDSAASNSDDGTANTGSGLASSRVSALLANATRNLPNSLALLATTFNKSLAYSPAETTDDRAIAARDRWKASLQQQASNGSIEAVAITEISKPLQITYPTQLPDNLLLADELAGQLNGRAFSACLEEDPSDAEIGVFFDAQGKLVDAAIIRSTGYMLLDEKIRAIASVSEDLPHNSLLANLQPRRSRAYTLKAEVDYDKLACVSLSDLKNR